jgi:aryl-alcohol dehydrogenase-like predicted oxidoreductase
MASNTVAPPVPVPTPFATMEANYSILVRDAEKTIIPALRDHKMRLLP